MTNFSEIIILGGGLTGLSTAYFLQQAGFNDYSLFEKEAAIGGLLRSEQSQGFTFDYTGHFLHISDPRFNNFLADTIGFENLNRLDRHSYIYTHGRMVPYPFQQNLGHLPFEVGLECIQGFIDKDGFKDRIPVNFEQWVIQNFGAGIGKHFFFPYNSKLLNQRPDEITPSWTQRFVPNTTLEQILRSLWFKSDYSAAGYNASFWYPKRGGICSLIKAIDNKLQLRPYLNKHCIAVDPTKKIVTFSDGERWAYNHLITTMPLPNLLRGLQGTQFHGLAEQADNLRCNLVWNFNLGIKNVARRPEHWIYFPETQYAFFRLGFWHNFAEKMAPLDCLSMYGEVSLPDQGYSQQELQIIKQRAIAQALDFVGALPDDVVVQKELLLTHAYVVYDRWREEHLSALLQQLRELDIHTIGRFGAWKYSSMQEAVLDGQQIVDALM